MTENQLKISYIKHQIKINEEEELVDFYGIILPKYDDNVVEKYTSMLDNINDKIYLSQWCRNYNKTNEFINSIELSDYQKEKYDKLKQNNKDINETINFKILDEKYSFLDKILDLIVADLDIQDQILSLSEERLNLFKQMYLRLEEITDYFPPYISAIMQKIGYVSLDTHWKNKSHVYDLLLTDLEEKTKKGYVLFKGEIDKLLLLCTSSINYNISSLEQMNQIGCFTDDEKKDLLKKIKEEKNIENIKFLVLAYTYGISLETAKTICNRYNLQGIEKNDDNSDLFEMYKAISRIVNENDSNTLIAMFEEFLNKIEIKQDFRRIVVFENELRKAFAHDLNSKAFKTDDNSFSVYDGVRVYDSGTSFNMIVTAIGAYQQEFNNQSNYKDYWNSAKINTHGNCCSLIGNSNLSTAQVKNIILGFSTMSENMLLLSGNKDIDSTPSSMEFDMTSKSNQNFMAAENMLNNTRGDYNELVYERRDLSSNPIYYKKNPDYIVFIEEYEDFDDTLKRNSNDSRKVDFLLEQRNAEIIKWQETVKAAKDFGVPIVKINREKVAKSEIDKINKLVEFFKNTYNPELLEKIITKFENNRVGNAGIHLPIREIYFSQKTISSILLELKDSIESIDDDIVKNQLYFSLYNYIKKEQEKFEKCMYTRNQNQTPGINFKDELSDIEERMNDESYKIIIGGIKRWKLKRK